MQRPSAFRLPDNMINEIEREVQATTQPRLPLLEEREHTHGSFEDNAIISQSLKSAFRSTPKWSKLTEIEREAMDMIACKFSRILSGKSMQKQHWEDIVGYAKLIEEKCF
jgi:hypothetical protein